MTFKSTYFQDEIRDDFYVPGKIKRAWGAQLVILQEIDRICKKYEIPYYAEWGTLLGAVRHRGFIPWDDDLDIGMKRQDYHRFLAVAPKELPKNYYLNNFHEENDYTDYMTRVVNEHAINCTREHLSQFCEFPYVVGIDIFVLDALAPTDEENRWQVGLLQEMANRIARLEQIGDVDADSQILKEELQHHKAYLEGICDTYDLQVSEDLPLIRQFLIASEQIMAWFSNPERNPNPEYVTLMPLWVNHGYYRFLAKYYETLVKLPFENTQIPVPLYYYGVLRMKYGEFWKLVRKGSSHNYPFYEPQEEILREHGALLGQEYSWPGREAANARRQRSKSFKLQSYIEILYKIQGMLGVALKSAQAAAVETLLTKGQEVAIDLGTKLEQMGAFPEEAVRHLENYCELLYRIKQKLWGDGQQYEAEVSEFDILELYEMLSAEIQAAEACVTTWFQKMHRVIFLCCKPSDFESYRDIYQAYAKKPGYLLQVIAVPFYEREFGGGVMQEQLLLEGYPQEISVVSGKTYPLEYACPQEIFTCMPWDGYNRNYRIAPQYATEQLWDKCERLHLLLGDKLYDWKDDDQRSEKNLRDYLYMPGCVYADQIWTRSAAVRDAYVKALSTWSTDVPEAYWEQKVHLLEKLTRGEDTLPELENFERGMQEKSVALGSAEQDKQEKMVASGSTEQDKQEKMAASESTDHITKLAVYFDLSALVMQGADGRAHFWREFLETTARISSGIKTGGVQILLLWDERIAQYEGLSDCVSWPVELIDKKLGLLWKGSEEELAETADAFYGDCGSLETKLQCVGKPVLIRRI